RKIRLIDTTLRDGSHSVSHQYSLEQIQAIAAALDKAKVDSVEVGHGDGLGGSSIQFGRSKEADRDMLRSARGVLTHAKLAVLLLPGVGVKEDLEMAASEGTKVARIATH